MDGIKFPKPLVIEDKKYLAWIRKQPCFHCGRYGVNPHHTVKKNDHMTLPACFNIHRLLHDIPYSEWHEKFGFDKETLKEMASIYYARYVEAKRLKDGER